MNSNNPSLTFSISYSKNFKKQLERLPRDVGVRISIILDEIVTSGELPRVKALVGNLRGLHSIRVGDYRLILRIDFEMRNALISDVGHRREIYD